MVLTHACVNGYRSKTDVYAGLLLDCNGYW